MMALISKNGLKRAEKTISNVHKPVEATYSVFIENGKRYLQLDTYGSVDREIPNKVSQSLQLDEETLEFLVSLLKL